MLLEDFYYVEYLIQAFMEPKRVCSYRRKV